MTFSVLLVDIGNTRLKWWYQEGKILIHQGVLPSKDQDLAQSLENVWLPLDSPQKVLISNVGGEGPLASIQTVCESLWSKVPQIIESSKEAFGMRNGYEEAQRLGVDRWLALIGADVDYPRPFCVIDFGTAITVDCVDSEGLHLGGLIAPGLLALTRALPFKESVGFKDDAFMAEPLFATSTENALLLGRIHLMKGFVRSVFLSAESAFDGPFCLILTGGDAPTVADWISMPSVLDPELVRKGLERMAFDDQ